MKIGIVCYPTFGGSGVVATELGMALAAQGHQVHFISYSQPFRLDVFSGNLFYHEVPVTNYPLFEFLPYEISLTSKLVDVVMHQELDLLHVHYAIPHASAAYMARQILQKRGKRIPFITTLHGTDITLMGRDPSYQPVIEFAINESDGVTAVSDSLRQDTLKYFDISREIEVIPNFIDLENYAKPSDLCFKGMYAPNGERILTHISNFRPVKRIDDVVRVFERVHREVPSKLILAGDGPERGNVENLARQLGVIQDVVFLGKTKAIERILCMSDLFLLTSETESFGLSSLEAMASYVPVISTNTGGIPEVNVHGYSGFLSNVGDVDDMAKNALKLLKDEALMEQFKGQARKQAAKFNITEILPMYERMYSRLTGLPLN
ncbi:MAG TPA: N-acetyl-alpha-D-glucosaminyl L-malate synthase BshA [Flavobacteriales bacterium]|nr:N-acetyl-alpha-D-glucosaminyl L-malate synthase BshA [Flavobacteriales bacterium]HPH82846.1 N-acetyl-alpha-D-glucosaminyl L-malate synthase BshA [Flavobacteriales bacterium]